MKRIRDLLEETYQPPMADSYKQAVDAITGYLLVASEDMLIDLLTSDPDLAEMDSDDIASLMSNHFESVEDLGQDLIRDATKQLKGKNMKKVMRNVRRRLIASRRQQGER